MYSKNLTCSYMPLSDHYKTDFAIIYLNLIAFEVPHPLVAFRDIFGNILKLRARPATVELLVVGASRGHAGVEQAQGMQAAVHLIVIKESSGDFAVKEVGAGGQRFQLVLGLARFKSHERVAAAVIRLEFLSLLHQVIYERLAIGELVKVVFFLQISLRISHLRPCVVSTD